MTLRALHGKDRREWEALRAENIEWLRPWEATSPWPVATGLAFRQLVRQFDREAAEGRLQPFVIETEGRLVGQVHLFGIAWGSLRSACAGYWVAESVAGQGIMPFALAAACDHAFLGLGLHRVEVNIRPENAASLRVVEKLGFRDEGLRLSYLHIDGEWRDHRSFALTSEDLGGSTLVELWNNLQHQSHQRHTEAGPQ
ncbi:MAG: GNAT family N-acetyltransferase [Actinobacteria bacterium]|nr:GNAT family N-acetyltransferase [Actinomycetota bacterium]